MCLGFYPFSLKTIEKIDKSRNIFPCVWILGMVGVIKRKSCTLSWLEILAQKQGWNPQLHDGQNWELLFLLFQKSFYGILWSFWPQISLCVQQNAFTLVCSFFFPHGKRKMSIVGGEIFAFPTKSHNDMTNSNFLSVYSRNNYQMLKTISSKLLS